MGALLIIDILNVSKTMRERHSNSVSIIQGTFYKEILFHAVRKRNCVCMCVIVCVKFSLAIKVKNISLRSAFEQ